jgi:hypothetical protein
MLDICTRKWILFLSKNVLRYLSWYMLVIYAWHDCYYLFLTSSFLCQLGYRDYLQSPLQVSVISCCFLFIYWLLFLCTFRYVIFKYSQILCSLWWIIWRLVLMRLLRKMLWNTFRYCNAWIIFSTSPILFMFMFSLLPWSPVVILCTSTTNMVNFLI